MWVPPRQRLPEGFPDEILSGARDLRPQHINELAWTYPLVLRAVEALSGRGCAILGGDVYCEGEHDLINTGDNWYLDPPRGLQWDDFVRASAEHTVRWIEAYRARNAGAWWYTLVFVCDEQWLTSHD
jgi:hypothetical protein